MIKNFTFDDVIKENHVISNRFLYLYIFYKPVNICGKFQGYNYSQLEKKHGKVSFTLPQKQIQVEKTKLAIRLLA